MFFDGASRSTTGVRKEDINVFGTRILFVSLDNTFIPYSFTLTMGYSNNTTKFEAVIVGLELAVQISITSMTIYRESKLVVKQLHRVYSVKKDRADPYPRRSNS